jgi:hypothetical protein
MLAELPKRTPGLSTSQKKKKKKKKPWTVIKDTTGWIES